MRESFGYLGLAPTTSGALIEPESCESRLGKKRIAGSCLTSIDFQSSKHFASAEESLKLIFSSVDTVRCVNDVTHDVVA